VFLENVDTILIPSIYIKDDTSFEEQINKKNKEDFILNDGIKMFNLLKNKLIVYKVREYKHYTKDDVVSGTPGIQKIVGVIESASDFNYDPQNFHYLEKEYYKRCVYHKLF
jgi:hypothetical protein